MKTLFIVLMASLVAACAAPQKVISEAERQTLAVQWAMTEEVKLRIISAECAELDGILEAAANYAVRDWHQRNEGLIQSADEHFTYHMAMFNQGNWEGANLMSQQMVYAAVQKAEAQAQAALQVDASQKRNRCLNTLDQYKQGAFDLATINPQMAAQLSDLKSSRSIKNERMRLQRAIVKDAPKAGRSYYVVEKMWIKRGCERSKLGVLATSWPDEIYQGSCKNESVVIACKWGNCKELK